MADRLTRREAKRLALAEAVAVLRGRLDDPPEELLADACHDTDIDITTLDADQAATALRAALDEVADELDRRATRYLQEITPRKPRPAEVDALLLQLTDLGVNGETILRSKPRRHRHGWHRIEWDHPDGHPDYAEASTARIAVQKAVRTTEKRTRAAQRRGRAA